jgi:hypothetical protein
MDSLFMSLLNTGKLFNRLSGNYAAAKQHSKSDRTDKEANTLEVSGPVYRCQRQ